MNQLLHDRLCSRLSELNQAIKEYEEYHGGKDGSAASFERARHKLALYVHQLPRMREFCRTLGLELPRPDEVTLWLRSPPPLGQSGQHGAWKMIKLHKGMAPWRPLWPLRPQWPPLWSQWISRMFALFLSRSSKRQLSTRVWNRWVSGSQRRSLDAAKADSVPPYVRNMTDAYQIRGPWFFGLDCGMPWEVVSCLHKVLLVGPFSLVVQGTAFQLTLGIITSFLFTLVFGNYHALLRWNNNILQQLAHLAISFSLLIGLATKSDSTVSFEREAEDVFLKLDLACVKRRLGFAGGSVGHNESNGTNVLMLYNESNGSNATIPGTVQQCVQLSADRWVAMALILLTTVPILVGLIFVTLEVWESRKGIVLPRVSFIQLRWQTLWGLVHRHWPGMKAELAQGSSRRRSGTSSAVNACEISHRTVCSSREDSGGSSSRKRPSRKASATKLPNAARSERDNDADKSGRYSGRDDNGQALSSAPSHLGHGPDSSSSLTRPEAAHTLRHSPRRFSKTQQLSLEHTSHHSLHRLTKPKLSQLERETGLQQREVVATKRWLGRTPSRLARKVNRSVQTHRRSRWCPKKHPVPPVILQVEERSEQRAEMHEFTPRHTLKDTPQTGRIGPSARKKSVPDAWKNVLPALPLPAHVPLPAPNAWKNVPLPKPPADTAVRL